MFCDECGKQYMGNKCPCTGNQKYKKDNGNSDNLSSFDAKHRDNYMHFIKLKNELSHWERCFLITNDNNFKDLEIKTKEKILAFKRAQGRFFEEMIKVPWFWRCHEQGCEHRGTMSSLGNGETPRFCKTHFMG